MVSKKQLQANRRNAQESTGPKTEQGKALYAWLNVLQQGLFKYSIAGKEGLGPIAAIKPSVDYARAYFRGEQPRISGRDLLKSRGWDLDSKPKLGGEFISWDLKISH